jgi:diguanylate cyclase (GGDEF)-like protein/PAS domain S-box-containing protein
MGDHSSSGPQPSESVELAPRGEPLRILFVEDSPADVELLVRLLRRSGFELTYERVDDRTKMGQALQNGLWDVVLSDFEMPLFDGIGALSLLREHSPDIPFIIVSGSIGEAQAVEAMKLGASDYIMKDQPGRLVPALARELAEAQVRRERRAADERLEAERDFIGAVLDTQGALVLVLDTEGRITRVNRAFEKITHYSGADLVGRKFWEIFLLPDAAELERLRFAILRKEQFPKDHETIWLTKESMPRAVAWTETAIFDREGRVSHVIWTGIDVTEKNLLEAQMEHDALHDGLTGLANRALFLERLTQQIRHAKRRNDTAFAVLFLDLDRFKLVNDGLGHSAGDILLREAALRLEACVRPADTVARLGGDEFAILLEDMEDLSDATRVAERIGHALEVPIKLGAQDIAVSTSIGIAVSTTGYQSADDMVRDADTAMYRAKAQGRGRFEVFDQSMRDRASSLFELESDLRRAVDRGELEVHYQPIVRAADRSLVGFEALVRWKHPKRGLVPPSEFVPMAEELGLITTVDRWVLREACRQLKDWHARFPRTLAPSVSVNLSSRNFARLDAASEVARILKETGLSSQHLKLEITESALLESTDRAKQALWDLRMMGTQLHLDDFGTGFSSLSYLHNFPVSALKVDRSFIGAMKPTRDGEAIVRAIVSLAHNLDMEVVAEGVETEDQLSHLQDLGCDYAQGFHFSRPLARENAELLLAGAV